MDIEYTTFYRLHKMSVEVPRQLLDDPTTSRQTLQTCYHIMAAQLAMKLKKELLEEAMGNPDLREFTQRYYIHKTIAETIHEKLNYEFSDVEITFEFKEEDGKFGMANFHFNWS